MSRIQVVRRLSLVVLSLCWAMQALAGGWSSFEMATPKGNLLRYEGTGGPIRFFFASSHEAGECTDIPISFDRFYFFNGYLIAEWGEEQFYVIDERSVHVQAFNDRMVFERYLEMQQLKPRLWTRWYDRSYDEANFRWLNFFAVVMFPLTLLLIGLFIYSIYSLLTRKGTKVAFRSVKTVYTLAMTIFVLSVVLLQVFPQSI